MNGTIQKLVAERCQALFSIALPSVHHTQSDIKRKDRYTKSVHAKTIERDLKSSPFLAWQSLNNLLKLKSNKSGCNLDPNELNQFYNWFNMHFDPPVLPDLLWCIWLFSRDDVYRALHSVNSGKGCGPGNIPPRFIRINSTHFILAQNLSVYSTIPASVQVSSQTFGNYHTSNLSQSPKLPEYPKTSTQ